MNQTQSSKGSGGREPDQLERGESNPHEAPLNDHAQKLVSAQNSFTKHQANPKDRLGAKKKLIRAINKNLGLRNMMENQKFFV